GYNPIHPIVAWEQTGEIVDGRNRRDLAVELELAAVLVAHVAFPNEQAVLDPPAPHHAGAPRPRWTARPQRPEHARGRQAGWCLAVDRERGRTHRGWRVR